MGGARRAGARNALWNAFRAGRLDGKRDLAAPAGAHRFLHQCADAGRVRATAYRNEGNLAPDFGLDQRPADHARMIDAQLGHERVAETGRRHRENPVVALALVDGWPGDALRVEDRVRGGAELAIAAPEIVLAVEVFYPDRALRREAMRGLEHDLELLAIERHVMQPFVGAKL